MLAPVWGPAVLSHRPPGAACGGSSGARAGGFGCVGWRPTACTPAGCLVGIQLPPCRARGAAANVVVAVLGRFCGASSVACGGLRGLPRGARAGGVGCAGGRPAAPRPPGAACGGSSGARAGGFGCVRWLPTAGTPAGCVVGIELPPCRTRGAAANVVVAVPGRPCGALPPAAGGGPAGLLGCSRRWVRLRGVGTYCGYARGLRGGD